MPQAAGLGLTYVSIRKLRPLRCHEVLSCFGHQPRHEHFLGRTSQVHTG